MSSDQARNVLSRPNPFAVLFREIAELARAALRRSPYFELRSVSCDFSGGILTLRGRVPTYYLKQLAQAAVADVPGVVEVHNRLEVTPHRVSEARSAGWSEHRLLAPPQLG